MKKGDWFYHIDDDGSKKLHKCFETAKRGDGTEMVCYDYSQPNVPMLFSANRCKKLTRKEEMFLAKEKIDAICEDFGLWTAGDGEIEAPSAQLVCRKTRQRITI